MSLPSILVTDTNIWIDLDNGRILAEVFRLPYQFIIPDFAITEIQRPNWEKLLALGLTAHVLDATAMIELSRLRQSHHAISVVDLAAFLLARALNSTLVTGDKHLDVLARTNGIPVHGILWLLDEMVRYEVLPQLQAVNALNLMLEQGARLPWDECQMRFESWIK
jgi:hypothetical protein